jgi:hypothetical protein
MSAIPGTILAAKISPGDTAATFPTHEDIYGKGGLMTLPTLTDLQNLYTDRQKLGMMVYVESTTTYYSITSIGTPPGFKLFDPHNVSGLDTRVLHITGGTITGDLTVNGNFSVLGDTTVIETDVTTTSAFNITNEGTTTALTVTQVDGTTDIAEFIDGTTTALIIKGSGKVGINTDEPNEFLTVVGNISASGSIYCDSSLEISTNAGGATTLFVEDGKVGINNEVPNKELTVSGSISATEDIYGRNGYLTGTLEVGGSASFASSNFFVNSLNVGIGTLTPNEKLTVAGSISALNTVYANTFAISGVTVIDSSRNVFLNDITADGDLTVKGNFSVLGDTSIIETDVTTTSAFNITNEGTTTALTVTQLNGSTDIAEFIDGTTTALIIKGSGKVGINTDEPNEFLTVVGNISATSNLIGSGTTSYLQNFIIDGGSF